MNLADIKIGEFYRVLPEHTSACSSAGNDKQSDGSVIIKVTDKDDDDGDLSYSIFGDGKEKEKTDSCSCFKARHLEPFKRVEVRYLVSYEERDTGDPVKTFSSRGDLEKWLGDAYKGNKIMLNSIKVYAVDEELKIDHSFKLSSIRE